MSITDKKGADRFTVRFVDEKGASSFIGVQPGTMSAWRWRGQGPPYIKVGALVKYDTVELEKFLRSHMVKPRPRRRKRGK